MHQTMHIITKRRCICGMWPEISIDLAKAGEKCLVHNIYLQYTQSHKCFTYSEASLIFKLCLLAFSSEAPSLAHPAQNQRGGHFITGAFAPIASGQSAITIVLQYYCDATRHGCNSATDVIATTNALFRRHIFDSAAAKH